MFKIIHHDIQDDHVKIHFVSTIEVAEEVAANLASRYDGTFEVDETGIECCWDPGGMMMVGDEVFSFPLGSITVRCKAQHFDFFVDHLQSCEPRGNHKKYIKIHGKWICICLEVDEFEQLKKLVCDPVFALKTEHSYQRRESRLRKLEDDGHVQRVVKDADGNFYEASRDDEAVNPKLLN
ncbi:hypothetical protein LCGC14_0762340 [marine sediment metagenome]|uniref:Uncharacterized protein n=1 Tax=marine sediment metagenome TaxID=412755 RepID=A0A0F9SKS8_9ZZZZ